MIKGRIPFCGHSDKDMGVKGKRLSDILIHLDTIGSLFTRVEDLGIDSVDQRQLRGLSIATEDLKWSTLWLSYDLMDVQDQAFTDVWLD